MQHGFKLLPRNNVDLEKKTLLPTSITSADLKSTCDIEEVISQTVPIMLEVHCIAQDKDLRIIAKFGLDVSESHRIRHQNATATDAELSDNNETDVDEDRVTLQDFGPYLKYSLPTRTYCGITLYQIPSCLLDLFFLSERRKHGIQFLATSNPIRIN